MASGEIMARLYPIAADLTTANAGSLGHDPDYGFYINLDSAADEEAMFEGFMDEAYAGGGLTVELHYLMASATTGDVDLGAALQSLADGDDRSGAVAWAENTTVNTTVPAVAETIGVVAVTFTNGADMDSVAAGDKFRLRARRLGSADTAAGDMRLLGILVKET